MAVDIGASGRRHMLAYMAEGRMRLEEVYRLQVASMIRTVPCAGDESVLFDEIKNGLKKCEEIGKIPAFDGE